MHSALTQEHLKIIAPAWPLQNTVAVNPFWNQIDRPFHEVMAKMSNLVHHSLFMPTSYYLEKYRKGEITDQDVEKSLLRRKPDGNPDGVHLKKFIDQSAEPEIVIQGCDSFSDFVDRRFGLNWCSIVAYEIAKYASAFFDEGQALAKFPWRNLSFYEAWFAAQQFDKSLEESGIAGFYDSVSDFQKLTPEAAMHKIVSRFGFTNDEALALYVGRLSVINNGWASQFSYHEWRAQLGYPTKEKTRSIELIAIQMIVDFAIAERFEKAHNGIIANWIQSFQAKAAQQLSRKKNFEVNLLWQAALEISQQRQWSAQIIPQQKPTIIPKIQVAMCIDVRSETYRRAIEAESSELETIGFAGFFGLPFEYKKIEEKQAGARAPVLLKSGFTVQEEMVDRNPTQRIAATLARSFFRNLRKAPMSSFLFVELFSLPAFLKMVRNLFHSLNFSNRKLLPNKFSDEKTHPGQSSILLPDKSSMELDSKLKAAAAVLTHMGIKSRFARLIVLAGHGSHNTNNAFASASDCGACGGHAGDVNARFLADLLNDPQVRMGLKKQSIEIPSSTRFIAAVHETVTDHLYLLDQSRVPDSHREELSLLLAAIEKAGIAARQERQFARSACLDVSAWRRARNWSEVRPEWALAGNACFIVAPRSFTKNANFAGRSFLHDYDWRNDRNFETLELIMTAPMLVTNWINLQYYASTVAPQIYGSGNKVLHNLVNENGVVEGNGGDLRIGLPWQSVHDGEKFVHEPIRLSVFIAAPTAEIEKIISKHPTVRNLVANEWLFLFQIEEESGKIMRRTVGGDYL